MVKIYRICAARCSDNCVEKSEMGSKCKIRHSHNGTPNSCCAACYKQLLESRPSAAERKLRAGKAPVRTYNRKPLGLLEENCSLQELGERRTPRPVATPCSLQNADASEGAMECDDEPPPAENEAESAGAAESAGGAGGVGVAMDCDNGQPPAQNEAESAGGAGGAMDCDNGQPPAENEAERAGSAGGAGDAGGAGGAMDCDEGQRRTDPTR